MIAKVNAVRRTAVILRIACRLDEAPGRRQYFYEARSALYTFSNAWMMSSSSRSVSDEGIARMMLRSKRLSATGHVPFEYWILKPELSARLHGKPRRSMLVRFIRPAML